MKALARCLGLLILIHTTTAIAGEFEFYPAATYDRQIPALKEVIGHDWGEKITSHSETLRYVRALDAASASVQVVHYGETWEGRELIYLVVGSPENLARLDDIKQGMQKLADPRTVSEAEASHLIAGLPAVVWLEYAVHGNEISSTEAALLTAYHLAAATNDSVTQRVLENTIVIIDPLQNPDGRDRFVTYYRQNRSRWPDPQQQSAEHNEDWPGGRTNHYLFDMNRDWFALTQPETRGRVQAFLQWYPQVFVDLHEMGSNSTYYFPPPADPHNPEMTKPQLDWIARFGRNTARWFDEKRFDYFTREIFDSFYPGYGEGWPMYQGSLGMTYEQASTRGLVVKRDDRTVLQYRDAVQHHFIASIATLETASLNRTGVLRYFYDYRKSAIADGKQQKVKAYILPESRDVNRVHKLVSLLIQQGIQVYRAESTLPVSQARDYFGSGAAARSFPAGTYVVSLAQPAKRLANTLLAPQTEINHKFIQEQLRRYKKRIPDQIYDLTAWSMPLLFDVEAYVAESAIAGKMALLDSVSVQEGNVVGGRATLAYLLPWNSNSAARALAQLLRQKVRVFTSDRAFSMKGTKYPNGSLIIKVKNNPETLHAIISRVAKDQGVTFYATGSSWVDDGVNFGSGHVKFVKVPKVAMAYNIPTYPYSAGWARYLLEREYGYPVTIVNTMQLGRVDLKDFNVLILPNVARFYGNYGMLLGESGGRKLKAWVENGGTLVTFGEATRWLTDKKVKLLTTTREFKGGKPADKPKEKPKEKPDAKESKPNKPAADFNLETAILPQDELPATTPGAMMRVILDSEHWLASGYTGGTNVLVSSRNIYTPLKLDKGRNVGVYAGKGKVRLSGFTYQAEESQLANKAYLMHQRHGRGNVVAFAEDPNVRAFTDGLNLLFMNAVLLGPAH